LEDYIGAHDPHDVVVLADSGYDDKKIEMAIVNKHWNFIISSLLLDSGVLHTLYRT